MLPTHALYFSSLLSRTFSNCLRQVNLTPRKYFEILLHTDHMYMLLQGRHSLGCLGGSQSILIGLQAVTAPLHPPGRLRNRLTEQLVGRRGGEVKLLLQILPQEGSEASHHCNLHAGGQDDAGKHRV